MKLTLLIVPTLLALEPGAANDVSVSVSTAFDVPEPPADAP